MSTKGKIRQLFPVTDRLVLQSREGPGVGSNVHESCGCRKCSVPQSVSAGRNSRSEFDITDFVITESDITNLI